MKDLIHENVDGWNILYQNDPSIRWVHNGKKHLKIRTKSRQAAFIINHTPEQHYRRLLLCLLSWLFVVDFFHLPAENNFHLNVLTGLLAYKNRICKTTIEKMVMNRSRTILHASTTKALLALDDPDTFVERTGERNVVSHKPWSDAVYRQQSEIIEICA